MPFLSTLESVICRQLTASPAEKPHRAAAGAKTGQVIYFPSRAGKWPVQGLTGQFPRGPPGGSALPNSSATYGRRGNDSLPPGSEGVAFHDPTAWRYLVFHDPPAPIGPPCPSEFRTRSSRKSSKIWTTVPMRQFVATAARRERVAWAPHQAGPVAIHGHCLRLYPVRPAYRLTLDVDGGEIWAGVDQRREVSVFDNLFIRLVLPFPLDQHFFNLFSLFLRKMFNLIRLQFSRCIALLVFGHFCQIRND